MTTTADARREQARGNGVGQAGQFGHQAHSVPGSFDPGMTAAPMEALVCRDVFGLSPA